ncbi:Rapid ALkalinization Factor [Dillenia turbinata]|uniref:Rapid ALkalinization Factor n=1 Tax=Dillenia turbinata TaxID=194707 RepID=A0AAN8UMP4_9MAGN
MRRVGDSLALMVIIFLVYAFNVSAAVTASVAISSNRKWECDGTIDECFIGKELEMLMDSEISRRQLASTPHPTSKALNPGQAVCGREPYSSCLPPKQGDVHRGCNEAYGCRQAISGDQEWECNGTIGECFTLEEMEMLIDSEISWRQLGSCHAS